jgi:uncharacterized membrane protein YgcG
VRYTYRLEDAPTGFAASASADFFVGRPPFDAAVFAPLPAPPPLAPPGTPPASHQAGGHSPRAPVLTLGIRYGIHGDGARLSVAADGAVVLSTSLASLFRVGKPKVARGLAANLYRRNAAAAGQLRSAMAPVPSPLDDEAFAAAAVASGGDPHAAAFACLAAAEAALAPGEILTERLAASHNGREGGGGDEESSSGNSGGGGGSRGGSRGAAAAALRPLAPHVALQAATGFGDG